MELVGNEDYDVGKFSSNTGSPSLQWWELHTQVDLDDFERLAGFPHKWCVKYDKKNDIYYVQTSIYAINKGKKRTEYLHDFLMNCPKGMKVDHINHNPLDNRKENLRVITNDENTKHKKGRNKNNKSGYRNVSKQGKWWCVQLQIEGKNTILKKFPLDQLKEASIYAELKRNEIYGDFAGNS